MRFLKKFLTSIGLFLFIVQIQSVSARVICVGQPATLSWTSSNVVSCTPGYSGSCSFAAAPNETRSQSVSGPCDVSLTCTSSTGVSASASDSLTVDNSKVWNGSSCVTPGPTPCPAWSGSISSGACTYSGSVGSTAVGGFYNIPISGPGGYSGYWSFTCNDVSNTGTWTPGSAVCDAPSPTPGSCSGSHYSCNAGTSANNGSSGGYWTWNCNGLYGGGDVSCSELQPCGNGSVNPPTCTPKPTGVSLSATDLNISYGDSTTLNWGSTNATGCTGYNAAGWNGVKTTGGSQSTGSLTSARTFGLYCSNAGGDTYASNVTVNVCPIGTPTWNGSSCVNIITGTCGTTHNSCALGSSNDIADSGTNYQWQCDGVPNDAGHRSPVCTECLNGSADTPTCTPIPTLTFTSNAVGGRVSYNGSLDLTWVTGNTPTVCTATNFWSGSKNTAGGVETRSGITSAQTFNLQCSNAGGSSVLRTITITPCTAGTPVWNGTSCVNTTGTISASSPTCLMAVGTAACNTSLTWSTVNPVGMSEVTRNLPAGSVFTANNGTAQSTSVSGLYPTVRYYLYNSAVELAHVDVSAICSNGLYWSVGTSNCAACTNGGCTGTGGSVGSPIPGTLACTNGANNVPLCNQCNAPQAWNTTTSACVPCTNGGCSGTVGGSSSDPDGNLVCLNGSGDAPTCTPKPNQTISLDGSASLSISNYSHRATIAWNAGSNNGTYPYSSCSAGGSWGGTFPPYTGSGLSNTLSTGGTFPFTYSCTNAGGTTIASAQVTVCPSALPVLSSSGCQAAPVASLSWVTGNYTALGKMRVSCANADYYALKRDGVTVGGESGATGGNAFTKVVDVTIPGTYSLLCSYDDVNGYTFTANNAVNLVYQNSPPEPVVAISATPASIAKGSATVLSWTVMFPNSIQIPPRSACTLTAKPICTNGICTTAQNDASTTVNAVLRTGLTDATDPAGQRAITTAVNTLANPSNTDDWRATGKKTLDLEKSMDFFLRCGAGIHASSSVEVLVTSRNEG